MPAVTTMPEADIAACPETGAATAFRRRTTLWLVAGGMFMAVLDATIVNVALPSMRADLQATVADLAWIVDAYTLSMAALILAGGVLADRWGAKCAYLFGLALFVVASILCGAAPSVSALVIARLAQGAGAAMFLPASLAVVRGTFDDLDERARAIATWAFVASLAAAVGPILGGWLVEAFGWRSVFLVNAPTGLAAFVLTARIVAASPLRETQRFDWGGQISSTAMLGGLCFAAIELPVRGPSSWAVWMSVAFALVATAAFIRNERRTLYPLVPFAWFRNPVFVAANLIGGMVYVGYFGMLFALSIHLSAAYGLGGRATGLALLPVAASLAIGNILAGRLQARLAPQLLIAASMTISGISAPVVAMLLVSHAPWIAIVAALMIFGARTRVGAAGDCSRPRTGPRNGGRRRRGPAERAAPIGKPVRRCRRERRIDPRVASFDGSLDGRDHGRSSLWRVGVRSSHRHAPASGCSIRCVP